jgi:hypothetical protein
MFANERRNMLRPSFDIFFDIFCSDKERKPNTSLMCAMLSTSQSCHQAIGATANQNILGGSSSSNAEGEAEPRVTSSFL